MILHTSYARFSILPSQRIPQCTTFSALPGDLAPVTSQLCGAFNIDYNSDRFYTRKKRSVRELHNRIRQ